MGMWIPVFAESNNGRFTIYETIGAGNVSQDSDEGVSVDGEILSAMYNGREGSAVRNLSGVLAG